MHGSQANVMRYFQSWHEPADVDLFQSSLHEHVRFRQLLILSSGGIALVCARALASLLRQSASAWRNVSLLKSLFLSNQGGPNSCTLKQHLAHGRI